MCLIYAFILICIIIWLYFMHQKENPKPIFGIYSQEGKWYYIKYFAMLLLLKLRKYSPKKKSGMGYTIGSIDSIDKMQPLSIDKKAFDAVFYHGVSKNGYYFVGGIERRHNGKANGLIYLLIPNLGLLHSERMPKTELRADLNLKNSFAGEGISFTPIVAMQRWSILYKGKMWAKKEEVINWYDVKFEAEFTSNFNHFTFDTDSDQQCLSRSIAKEAWSKEFFEILESSHQTHYEQMGTITGKLTINALENGIEHIEMMGFRDHSFGNKRDWSMLHRYIFHMFYMDDDTRISCGVISQPCSISHFEIGYVIGLDKKVHAIQNCDLKLYQHGEDGKLPKNLAFSFISNNQTYDCKVTYLCDSVHYKGSDVEAKLYERFFTCEVNGRKGRGISEWHYNNMGTYFKS